MHFCAAPICAVYYQFVTSVKRVHLERDQKKTGSAECQERIFNFRMNIQSGIRPLRGVALPNSLRKTFARQNWVAALNVNPFA
jgi:hypothetical protein